MAGLSNLRVAMLAGGLAVSMVGMDFAAVPLYRIFCEVTGFGGTTMRVDAAVAATVVATNKPIVIRFDANHRGDQVRAGAGLEGFVDRRLATHGLHPRRRVNPEREACRARASLAGDAEVPQERTQESLVKTARQPQEESV